MRAFLTRSAATLPTKILLSAAVAFSASVASAQTYGFDNIGTDPAAIGGQKCLLSGLDTGGGFARLISAWSPPASSNPSVQFSYSLNSFRAVVGLIPAGTPPPSQHMNWALYVYDSFESFRNDANLNWRAVYTFNFGSPSITSPSAPTCMSTAAGNGYNTPCWYLNLNLNSPSSVAYKTAAGQPTNAPFYPSGGGRYWFSLVGFNANAAQNGSACVVRTNASLPAQYSPPPSPPISFPMNSSQCSEAGMPYPCNFPLAHNEFYKLTQTSFQCNPARSAVNWTNSPYNPLLNTSFNGLLPLTCGGGNQTPCCERTFAGKTAYALTASLRKIKAVLGTDISAIAIARLRDCSTPGC